MHSLQVQGCRAWMATADIQASTEQVFVLRCGGRLGALSYRAELEAIRSCSIAYFAGDGSHRLLRHLAIAAMQLPRSCPS